jgi:group I intron endonuclease
MGVIYMTTNLVNGKKYIGKDTKNNPNYLGSGLLLKRSIKKYGKHEFEKKIIEVCSSQEELIEREEYWLNYYDAANNPMFYNMKNKSVGFGSGNQHPFFGAPEKTSLFGRKGKNHPSYGKKHSDKTKKKMSELNRGKNNPMWGKQSPFLEKKHSDEIKKKLSELNRGKNNPNYGKTASEETKKKISESSIGRKHSDETKKKLSELNLGKKHSDESKKKMSESRRGEKNPNYGKFGENHPSYGKKHSAETKRKMSISRSKGYLICISGTYCGEIKTRNEWAKILEIDPTSISKHLSGKSYKNGIKGNFFKWEHELQS